MTRSMNQEKIGKLIAKLRKAKGLTQRQLGEMVGVGYRAVSKWETGLTMPDISIINELSTILGISSDELLKGELCLKEENNNEEEPVVTKNPFNKKKILFLLLPLVIIVVMITVMINNGQKPKRYTIQSLNPDEYLVEGTLSVDGDDMIIKIDKVKFQYYDFYQSIITNYQYSLFLNDKFLFGINTDNEYPIFHEATSIENFSKQFTIDYDGRYVNNIEDGKLIIELIFYKADGKIIKKQIETTLIYKK